MADVKFNVETVGIPKVKADLKSVFDEQKKYSLSVVQLHQNTSQKIREIKEDAARHAARLDARLLQGHKSAADAKIRLEQETQNRITRLQEREGLRRQQIQAREAQGGFGLAAGGHLLQTAGFFRAGHALRAIQALNISAGSIAAVGAIALAAAPVAIALYGMAEAIKYTAGAFIGATATIGGARGLQAMIVETASTERAAAGIAANSVSGMNTAQVMAIIRGISSNGEFAPGAVGEGMRAFVGKTGDAAMFGRIGGFASNLASVSGMTMQETGGLLGGLQTQFGMNDEQLKQTAMQLWMQGRAGTVELKDAASISQALAFSRMAGGGNINTGISREMGLTQLTQKGLGGTSADEAVTAVRRLQEDLSGKSGTIQGALGGGSILGTDAQGNKTFANFGETISRLSLFALRHPDQLKGLGIDERAARVPRAVGEFAAQTQEFKDAGKDKYKELEAVRHVVEAMQDGKLVVDEFNGSLKMVQDTTEYQLRKAFNDIAEELQEPIMAALKDFASAVIANKDTIVDSFKAMVNMFEALIPVGFTFGNMMLKLLAIFEPLIPGLNADDIDKARAALKDAQEDYNATKHGHEVATFVGKTDEQLRQEIIREIEEKYPSLKGDKALEDKPLSAFSKEEIDNALRTLLSLLSNIDQNTKNGKGTAVPGAPPRDPDAVQTWNPNYKHDMFGR